MGKAAMSTSSFERPREIITFCLKPFEDQKGTPAYEEAFRRLEHVIRTYQSQLIKAKTPVVVDFSNMPTVIINEDAHGH
jgi:hypothetical protein